MTRSYSALLACLALSVACASKSKGSDNPDAGQYDGYQSDGGSGDQTKAPTGPRPKARASTATKAGATKKGKSLALVSTKPPVSGGDKPRPTRTLKAEFSIEGVVPTTAAVGSLIEIHGSGFPTEAGATKVFVGGKPLKLVETAADRIVAEVTAPSTGVVEVGLGSARINRRNRAKSTAVFTGVAADAAFGQPRTQVGHGLVGEVYEVPAGASEVPNFGELGAPVALVAVDDLDVPAGNVPGVAGRSQNYGIHFQGSLNVVEKGSYELCLTAGDGALFFLDQVPVIDADGTGASREVCETLEIEPGEYKLDLLYYQGADAEGGLTLSWAKDGGAKAPIPSTALFPPENLFDLATKLNTPAGG